MGLMRFIGDMANGVLGFIFKLILVLLIIVFVLAVVAALIIYWPFTIMMLIGILLSPVVYKFLNRRFGLRLPKYFYYNVNDFFVTLNHGEEHIERKQMEVNEKIIQARQELQDMLNALDSLDEQLKQIETKKSLRTLFKPDVGDISPRAAKALEMELGKPLWSQHIDKVNQESNGDWTKYMSVPDME